LGTAAIPAESRVSAVPVAVGSHLGALEHGAELPTVLLVVGHEQGENIVPGLAA
jgi:hypothetical protein